MKSGSCRAALWALVLLGSLAPSHALLNIGCLFSPLLCVEGAELCYDDSAFGRCVGIDTDLNDASFAKYDLGPEELEAFENEIESLTQRGYRWEHSYTQCVLQTMLFMVREPKDFVNVEHCERYAKMDAMSISESLDNSPDEDIESDEVAFVRFTPNGLSTGSDFANEVYAPPATLYEDITEDMSDRVPETGNGNDAVVEDIRELLDPEFGPEPVQFQGFRERVNAAKENQIRNEIEETEYNEQIAKIKKSIQPELDKSQLDPAESVYLDEDRQRLGKIHTNGQPHTVEYITSNRLSPQEVKFLLEKYRESFYSKTFPFEYEDGHEISEPRIYVDEDRPEHYHADTGSGEADVPHEYHDPGRSASKLNYWAHPDSSHDTYYAEGGTLKKPDDKDLSGLLSRYGWGFERRERDDVKKPGPRLDAIYRQFQYHKNASASPKKIHRHLADWDHGKHESDKKYDPTYTFVEFKDEPYTWYQGDQFVLKALELLGLEDNVFTKPRVYVGKVTFKVFNNSKNMNASEVALRIVSLKKELKEATGLTVLRAGVGGNKAEGPAVEAVDEAESRSTMELPMIVMVGASLGVLAVGATTFFVLMRRDDAARRKMTGLASAADIDAEATRDYQELCRARMSGKWVGHQSAPPTGQDSPQRIASLSKEPDNNSPSTRSSTSSWSEEPALTNMDISTGHMVLAYMEDHLKNKDRLEQEWAALCAYEAEPCACTSALRPENANKNRYADLLPYDHSRLVLNALSNHLGCDYINASTITDHDPRNPAYIAAAGPLAHTAPDFWQMVWEQGAVVMVMLTRLSEGGQQLCHRYWPEDGSELYHIYEVHLVSEHIWCDDYLVRSFYLKNQKTGETRTVTQFHFLSWPDNGVPSSTKALLEFRRKVNKSYRGRSCPVVVHCSDGASRTGTYCLIDMVLNRMAKGAKEIDIAATLEHIRDQRPRMVATKQQFEFVLMAVAEEVHAILKALPAQLQAQREKDAEKEKEKRDKPAN